MKLKAERQALARMLKLATIIIPNAKDAVEPINL